MAGVKIELIVRGVCTLRPGIPGVSDNITVRSILDRFLEHSRIFSFRNGGEELLFISSADWMPRNMERRVELLFPIYDKRVRKRLLDLLSSYLSDDVKMRMLQTDGTYTRKVPGAVPVRIQAQLLAAARRK